MKLSDFDFALPNELIAQSPTQKRDHSNLLILEDENKYRIAKFFSILDLLKAGDLMVFNDSRVVNAKLNLDKGVRKISINLNKAKNDNIWLGFAKPARKLKEGDEFFFDEHKLIIDKKLEAGEVEIKFELKNKTIFEFLDQYGEVPLPQYIKRALSEKQDIERYQNVYSKEEGSVAAPTAGLHFTEELLDKIKEKGVEISFVTLHVGAGTFLPVKVEDILEHKMHSEYCEVTIDAASKINKAKKAGRRIIVVGTTAMRTLESCSEKGIIIPQVKETNIFITPGHNFQIADLLITNFHLPKSTLFMLICAFSGMQKIKDAYEYAIENKMRFFSYGDAMIIEKNNSTKEGRL